MLILSIGFRQFLNIAISGRGKSNAELVCFFIVIMFKKRKALKTSLHPSTFMSWLFDSFILLHEKISIAGPGRAMYFLLNSAARAL